MGKMGLQIAARLENVKQIEVCGEDFRWYIKTRCTNCGELAKKWQYVTLGETHEGRTGRSNCHMLTKCKGCTREVSLTILEQTIKPYVYNEEKDEDFQTIAVFEGRGIEVADFEFRGGWHVLALNSSTGFGNVDLTEKDWADFDEKAEESVAIYELQHKIVRA